MNTLKVLQISGLLTMMIISPTAFSQPKVGEISPLWTEGILDIHHINTGKGECSFFILPDGTTMLVDAGATPRPKPRVTDPKPDGSRTPGDWISRYISHFLRALPEKKLNYVLLTHFHDDHIGGLYPGLKTSIPGKYILTGITEVGENFQFDRLVDRGWPDYAWPKPMKESYIQNYITFVKFVVDYKGVKAEKFRVDANDQFLLVHHPKNYPNFEIRNIASNGHVWTGIGNKEETVFHR